MRLVQKYREPAGRMNFGLYTKKVPLNYADIVDAAEMADSNRKMRQAIEEQRRKEAANQSLQSSITTPQDNTNIQTKQPTRTYEQAKQDFENGAHYTGTLEPYNEEAHKGWMEVDPRTGETTWHAPTIIENNLEGADMQQWHRMWSSPALQLALGIPLADLPFIFKNINYNGVPFADFEEIPLDYTPRPSGNVSVPSIENRVEPLQVINVEKQEPYTMQRALALDEKERALAKINGYKDYQNQVEFADDVTKGVSEPVYNMMRHNMVNRYKRAYLYEGGDPGYLYKIDEVADDAMRNVNIGRYTQADYNAAGYGEVDGFYQPDRNFISLNLSKFGEPHEVEHLLYEHMPISQLQARTLADAYGKEFINLPNTPFASRIERMTDMRRELVTLNWDGRMSLLGNNMTKDLATQDAIIRAATPTQVFEALARASEYGNHFVNYLYSLGRCTPERAEAIKKAMIYVGSAAPFVMRGNSEYNYVRSKFNRGSQI